MQPVIQTKPEYRHRAESRGDRKGARIWIEAALDFIVKEGHDKLKVERLSEHIGVSKGSFYWFFSDMDDLCERALLHWRKHANEDVYEEIRNSDEKLPEKLDRLINTLVAGQLGRYDAAIRSWALRNPVVAQCVREVDAARLAFLTEVFTDAYDDEKDAAFFAHLFYRALVAESFVELRPNGMNRQEYLEQISRHFSELVTSPDLAGSPPRQSEGDLK